MTTACIEGAFSGLFQGEGQLGAALAIWSEAGRWISLIGGHRSRAPHAADWTEDTLVPVWSTTKGPAAATLLWALDRHGLSTDTPVHHIWPELGSNVSVGQLLSHQAGLAALDVETSVFDHRAAVIALERQTPAWPPGTGHGYHPRTFGPLVDECVRRLTGAPLADVWRREIAEPLQLDVWIGLPESEDDRVATVHPSPSEHRPEEQCFIQAFSDRTSLTRRAFSSLAGLTATSDMNRPEARRLGHPAFGGVASAIGLARFYHALVTGEGGIFSPAIRRAAESTLTDGDDTVLCLPTAFAAGFQKDPIAAGRKRRYHYGPSWRAFGHPGAGGSLAFGDPDRNIGFAFVLNRIAPGVMPGKAALSLVEATYL
ncbi:MAG: serine hydrolase domain-containing protein [Verrucomicrobiales bacterium]